MYAILQIFCTKLAVYNGEYIEIASPLLYDGADETRRAYELTFTAKVGNTLINSIEEFFTLFGDSLELTLEEFNAIPTMTKEQFYSM